MAITGGKVSFSRTVKVADFEPKNATVELSFGIEEDGQEPQKSIDAVAGMALETAMRMLGFKSEKALAAAKSEATAVMSGAAGPVPGRRGPGRPPKLAQSPYAPPAKTNGNGNGADAVARALEVEEPADAEPTTTDAPTEGADAAAVADWEKPPAITDVELTSALTRKMGELKDGPRIRAVVQKFTRDGSISAATIPQDKRADFLIELKALA